MKKNWILTLNCSIFQGQHQYIREERQRRHRLRRLHRRRKDPMDKLPLRHVHRHRRILRFLAGPLGKDVSAKGLQVLASSQ